MLAPNGEKICSGDALARIGKVIVDIFKSSLLGALCVLCERPSDPKILSTAKHAKVGVGMSETQESDYRGADLLADAVMPAQGEREIFVCLLSAQRVAAGLPVKRSISCNSSVLNAHSTAATFCATWSALVAPAMTLATAGCAANQENASSTRP